MMTQQNLSKRSLQKNSKIFEMDKAPNWTRLREIHVDGETLH